MVLFNRELSPTGTPSYRHGHHGFHDFVTTLRQTTLRQTTLRQTTLRTTN